ncbi:nitrile hydratase subunit alpha [Natronorubrum sp. FCH18a]|uniref:nitrile hydratase subunit alpha n=1 Tax=Natronorubrum sp. FCH18a TaxID=3447018 RepID=UPI003F519076
MNENEADHETTEREDHDHEHPHSHEADDPDDLKSRTRALQSLLLEKGVISTEAVDEVLHLFEEEVGPMNGARVVTRAWSDPAFKERLLTDADAAIAEFDFEIGQQHVSVVENTPSTHNVVVCTLCSCYPWSLLGLPPTWYKSPQYRSRVVREPRAVLSEFGLDLDSDVDVSVWDSSSEVRYMVLPQPPEDVDDLEEDELVQRVTRDAMIGVERLGDDR